MAVSDSSMIRLERWSAAIFLLLAFLFWGGRTLWDSSEARYGQVAFEMLASGNWLLPSLAGKVHLSKPPLTYWMTALGMKLFGVNAWGARFFLSAFFFGTILCVRELGKTMGLGNKQALAAALIFATSAVSFAGGHTLTTDGFLSFWETLGVLAAWKVWQASAGEASRWRLVFWGAFAFAFFTKGPPGWLPLLSIGAFLWIRRRTWARPGLFSGAGLALFLVISFWWYGLLVWQHHDLVTYFVRDEVINRVFTSAHHRDNPFWMFLPVILFGVGPWMLLWPGLFRRLKAHVITKGENLQDRQLFLLLWGAVPFVVFTLAKSRMILYVAPLFVPVSLALGRIFVQEALPRLKASSARRRSATALGLIWLLVLSGYTCYPDSLPGSRSHRREARVFTRALRQLGGKSRLYWIRAGRQRYSLSFYMRKIIHDTNEIITTEALETVEPSMRQDIHLLYVTKGPGFAELERSSGPLDVVARSRNYILFEVPRAESKSRSLPRLSGDRRL